MKLRGALGLAFVTAMLAPGAADAYIVKHTSHGTIVRWDSDSIAWTIDPTVATLKGATTATTDATRQWSGQKGAPVFHVKTAKSARKPGYDGVSGPMYVAGGFAPAGKALAVTILTFDDRNGTILDADVVINGSYAFAHIAPGSKKTSKPVDEHDAPAGSTYDIGRVVAHETGHALGLGDEPDHQDAIMYPYVAAETASTTTPGADDLAGLDALYESTSQRASDATAGGSHGCSSSGAGAPEATFTLLASIAGALVLLRRRRAAIVAAFGACVLASGLGTASAADDVHAISAMPRWATARAVVASSETTDEDGLFRSTLTLSPRACSGTCARLGTVQVWGGVRDGIRQEVGGQRVPRAGEIVDVVVRDDHVRVTLAR